MMVCTPTSILLIKGIICHPDVRLIEIYSQNRLSDILDSMSVSYKLVIDYNEPMY